MLTAEAARIAQLLGFNKAICQEENEATCHRTFWVVYILEKTMCFACSKASVSLLPDPEWFLLSRLGFSDRTRRSCQISILDVPYPKLPRQSSRDLIGFLSWLGSVG